MKPVTKMSMLASGLVLLAGLAGILPSFWRLTALNAVLHADNDNHDRRRVIVFDVAVDCRTAVTEFERGGVFVLNGKIFPGGTLPSGTASNDPTEPVNGVAAIGDQFARGHHAFPLPPELAQFYSSAPGDFATGYSILDGGRSALITEAYAFLEGAFPSEVRSVVTAAIGAFSGAAGEVRQAIIGTNITGCPNFRYRVQVVPASGNK
jgi:hypothetical protein